MNDAQWIERYAARLRRAWPTLVQADLVEAAAELCAEPAWRAGLPEEAASAWLRLRAVVR